MDGFPTGRAFIRSLAVYHGTREQIESEPGGIYRARFPTLQGYGKAVTTWASVKQGALR